MKATGVQFPTRAVIFFYGICMFIVHQSSDFIYYFINMHPHFQQSTIGVVVLTPASHRGEWGSNPIRALLLWFFVGLAHTLRAKITPFPRKDFGKNLPKRSTNSTCSFKPKKFTVGHFDLGRYVCLRNLDCVKDNDYKLYFL